MQFHKFQALGNDFVFFGSPTQKTLPSKELIQYLCDRHYGVGADCAVFISASKRYDYFMHVYNPDGFEAEMCGNALRCSAHYVAKRGFFSKNAFIAETKSGPRSIFINDDVIHAEIGKPIVLNIGTLNVGDIALNYFNITLGNPHCVIFTSCLNDGEFNILGSTIENHPIFPNGTNVEFASVIDRDNISIRIWERGIGETHSCVTGSCACVAAAIQCGYCNNNVAVHQKGGIVNVETRECGNMFVSGRCTNVFKGELLHKF